MDKRIQLLLEILDQAFDRKAWHGTNLKGSIRGLTLSEAVWRPHKGRHSIWEITLHCAYWKFCVRRHLTGDRSLSFPRAGSDWPRLPAPPSAAAWKQDARVLSHEHALLREALAEFPVRRLAAKPPGLSWRYEQYIYGASSHDLYHAGQIQLLKRIYRSRERL